MSSRLPQHHHHQLTEFTSLIRAIRVHADPPLAHKLTHGIDDDDNESENPNIDQELDTLDDDGDTSRWPLDPGDVVVPRWRLRDEILSYARAVAPKNPLFRHEEPPTITSVHQITEKNLLALATRHERKIEEVENEALEPLPSMTIDLIGYMIDMMAAHLHPEVGGYQNRSRTIDWQDVLDILSGSLHGKDPGPLSLDILESARDRLEELYGAPDLELRFMDLPVDPDPRRYAKQICFSKDKARSYLEESESNYLEVPLPLSDLRQKRSALKRAYADMEEALGEKLDNNMDDDYDGRSWNDSDDDED